MQNFTPFLAEVSAAEENFTISEIEFQGNHLFAESVLQKAAQGFLGSNKTVKDLEKIQNSVFGVYKKAGYTLVSVLILKLPDSTRAAKRRSERRCSA